MLNRGEFNILINSGWLHFAGMRGRLSEMQGQGWSFAIDTMWDPRGRDELQLAARHESAHVTLIARSNRDLFRETIYSNRITPYMEVEFYVQMVAPRIEVVRIQSPRVSAFRPFDASEMLIKESHPQEILDLGALAFFRPVDASREIYIPEKEIWTVEKHLEAILEAQRPKQDELRKKHLDEQRKKRLNEGCETRTFASLIAV
jgi:hypothetical protein